MDSLQDAGAPVVETPPGVTRAVLVGVDLGPGHAFSPTNFERKYIEEGRVIRRFAFRRLPR